jgi:hypothetical protein
MSTTIVEVKSDLLAVEFQSDLLAMCRECGWELSRREYESFGELCRDCHARRLDARKEASQAAG